MGKFTFGIACKLGYGFTYELHRFYEFEARPENVESFVYKRAEINSVSDLSCTNLFNFFLGSIPENAFHKLSEFYIVNDDEKYYRFMMSASTRKDKCAGLEGYPARTEFYVSEMQHGTRLDVVCLKDGFPGKVDEMKMLLKSALKDVGQLNDVQKRVKCRVLINNMVKKEMTLEEVFKFKDECLENTHPEDEIVVAAGVKENERLPFAVKNSKLFRNFLSHVYACYRKIELKLEDVEYPEIAPLPEFDTSMTSIIVNLVKAKDDFKDMDMSCSEDVFKIYPVLKTLFWRYCCYLKFAMDHRLDIDEGDTLPGTCECFHPLLRKLNRWRPVKIADQWYGIQGDSLFIPDGFDGVRESLTKIIGNDMVVWTNVKLTEPHLVLDPEIDGFFGFVDMSGADVDNNKTANSTVLEIECPKKCSDDELKWICHDCGEVIKISKVYLLCSCGVKIFHPEALTCNHQRHRIQLMESESLKLIALQLRKHQDRNDARTNATVRDAANTIVLHEKDMDMVNSKLELLLHLIIDETDVIDGDTRHLIDTFLEVSKN